VQSSVSFKWLHAMANKSKDSAKKKSLNPFLDAAEERRLFDDFPRFKLKRVVQKQKPIDLAGPFNEECPSDFVFTTASGMCISTYPMDVVRNVRDAEPNCDSYRIKAFENAVIFAVCDGCGWGIPPKEASNCAKDVFVNYLAQKAIKNLKTLRDVGEHLVNALNSAHQAIVAMQNSDELVAGTTVILGGMILEVDIKGSLEKDKDGALSPPYSSTRHHRSSSTYTSSVTSQITIPPWVFVGVSVGDCKAFHYSVRKKIVTDITAGNRGAKNEISDPGGRIGPYLNNDEPDLRNLRALFWPCEEGDLILVTSDGVHDNLDPEVLGRTVKELKTLPFPYVSPTASLSDPPVTQDYMPVLTEPNTVPTQKINTDQKYTGKNSPNKEKLKKANSDTSTSGDKNQNMSQKNSLSPQTSPLQSLLGSPHGKPNTHNRNANIESSSNKVANIVVDDNSRQSSNEQQNFSSKKEDVPPTKNDRQAERSHANQMEGNSAPVETNSFRDLQGPMLIASPLLSTKTTRGTPSLRVTDLIALDLDSNNSTNTVKNNEEKQLTTPSSKMKRRSLKKTKMTSPRKSNEIENAPEHRQQQTVSITASPESRSLEKNDESPPKRRNVKKPQRERSPPSKDDFCEPMSAPLNIERTVEKRTLQSPKKVPNSTLLAFTAPKSTVPPDNDGSCQQSLPLLRNVAENTKTVCSSSETNDPNSAQSQTTETDPKNETWDTLEEPIKSELKEKFVRELLADLIGPEANPVIVNKRIIHHCLKVTAKSREWMEQNPNAKLERDWIRYPGKLDHTTCIVLKCTIHDPERDRAQKDNLIPNLSSIQ